MFIPLQVHITETELKLAPDKQGTERLKPGQSRGGAGLKHD